MKIRLLTTLFALSIFTLLSSLDAYAISGPAKVESHQVHEAATSKIASQKLSKRVIRKANRLNKKIQKRLGDPQPYRGDKSFVVAIILSVLLGGLGVDRFYLGYVFLGILKLLTFGGFGIWYLIDILLIATNSLRPKKGEYYDY